MLNFRMLKHSDIILWVSVALLILVGIMMIFSCTFSQQSREGDDAFYYTKRQFIAFIVGLIGLAVFAYMDYSHLKNASWFLYSIALAFLCIVLFRGFVMLDLVQHLTSWTRLVRSRIKSGMTKSSFRNPLGTRV